MGTIKEATLNCQLYDYVFSLAIGTGLIQLRPLKIVIIFHIHFHTACRQGIKDQDY